MRDTSKTFAYRLIANVIGLAAGLFFTALCVHSPLGATTSHVATTTTTLFTIKVIAMFLAASIISCIIIANSTTAMASDAAMGFMAMPFLWTYIKITDKFNLRSVMSPTSAIATIEMIIVGAITATILRKFAERETLYRNIYRASFLLVLPLANTFTNSNVHVLSILSGYILTYVYLDISQQRSDATVDTEDDDQFSVATNAITYLGQQEDTAAITMIVANNTSVASFKNSSPKSRVRNKRKKTKRWRQLRMLRRRSKRSRH